MKELKEAALRALLYFDIFSFPLRREEVRRFCRVRATPAEMAAALAELTAEEKVFCSGDYYLARNRPDWVDRRERNFRSSGKLMRIARRNAALIGQFPFVRGVAISGSLSKYSADDTADIDYFIITRARRLWVCRSLLHLFKKGTFLFGMQHQFCMNYFLDERELELKDQNIYTAVESLTIIPVFGNAAHAHFQAANSWLRDFFPNHPTPLPAERLPERETICKRLGQRLFAGRRGDCWNDFFRRLTINRWRRKFRRQGYPMEYFEHDFRSTDGESKNHPHDYQRKVLRAYRDRVEASEGTLERVDVGRGGVN